jgi:hypothetical protein
VKKDRLSFSFAVQIILLLFKTCLLYLVQGVEKRYAFFIFSITKAMSSSSMKRSSAEAIKVVVRIRPLSSKEIEDCRKM